MTKPTQPVLHSILVVPHRESLTEREIRKRGGPAEIMLKRVRALAKEKRAYELRQAEEKAVDVALYNMEYPRLGRMR